MKLLQFYLMTMRRTVGDDALLLTTLKEYVFSPRNNELVYVFVFYSTTSTSRVADMAQVILRID